MLDGCDAIPIASPELAIASSTHRFLKRRCANSQCRSFAKPIRYGLGGMVTRKASFTTGLGRGAKESMATTANPIPRTSLIESIGLSNRLRQESNFTDGAACAFMTNLNKRPACDGENSSYNFTNPQVFILTSAALLMHG